MSGEVEKVPCQFVLLTLNGLSSHESPVAQWQSIWTSNQKVIGSTPVGRTRIFSSESPVSLIEENIISHLIIVL